MTQPRNVRPGVTWFVTRRTTRRHFLLSPDEEGKVEQLYWYVTAVYAKQLGIELHMMQLLSSHMHEIVTDTRAQLPRFFELRNRALANGLKVLLGWTEEVFNKASANWVELSTPEAVVQESAYTVTNCVAAGLVRTPQRWPGAKVLVDDMGRRVVKVKRPDFYFDPENTSWPDEVSIPIVMPKLLEQAFNSHDECRRVVQVQVDESVRKAHALNHGRGYAGAKRVLKTPHTRRATSREEFGSRTPTFAAAGRAEVARAFVRAKRAFLNAYRSAWHAWNSGDHNAVFPYGSWKMRVYHHAPCHSPP